MQIHVLIVVLVLVLVHLELFQKAINLVIHELGCQLDMYDRLAVFVMMVI
jgi:Mlc titration factor MtfA (ptsG expression regulator)